MGICLVAICFGKFGQKRAFYAQHDDWKIEKDDSWEDFIYLKNNLVMKL